MLAGLRVRLLLLVGLAVLPALGTLLWVSRERWQAVEAKSRAEALRLARLAAGSVGQHVASARDVLATLTHAPVVKGFDLPRAEALFRELRGRFPALANIALTDVSGPIVASAVPLLEPVDASDRSWFRRAVAARGFAVGDYQIGRVTGKPTVNCADLVLGGDGAVRGLVFGALDLEVIHRQLADLQLGPGYSIVLVDASGTVCSRAPDAARFVGRPLPAEAASRAALARPGEVVEGPGADGQVRIYAAAPVATGGLAVAVGVSRDVALAAARATFRESMAVLAAAAACALVAAWGVGGALLVRPIGRLVAATDRVRAGDLAARSGVVGGGEIGALASAFDGMAAALQARAAEAATSAAALQAQARRLDLLHTLDAAILAARSLAGIAAPALAHLRRALGADRATLSAFDAATATVEILAADDDRAGALPVGTRLPLATMPGLADLQAGRISGHPDLAEFAEPAPAHRAALDAGIRATLAAPLGVDGQLIGILALTSRTAHGLDQVDQALLREVADQMAIALSQARLREALRAERDGLERRVAERTAALQAANTELDTFAYAVSHDLRAPLRAVDGFAQALLEDHGPRLDAEGQDHCRRVRAAAQRMGVLIDALLDLSRLSTTALRRERVDLSALAAGIIADFRAADPARTVAVSIAPDLVAQGDPHLVRVVLENLLGNAWKFTRGTAAARIEVARESGGAATAFIVRDNGAGFDPAYAGKLFGAFQRLHRSDEFEGTGIGLATVRRIVTRHGGEVSAAGAVGHGATIRFTLGA